MAFATKYHYTFKDYYNRTVLVNLQFDGFGGSSTELIGAGLEISWNSNTNDIYKPIRASVATIGVYQSTNTQLDEFFDITQTECRVQVTIGGSDYWYGFILSGMYQRPYKAAPNYVQLTAVDQVGILHQVEYKNSGAIYQGRANALTIINNCLLKTGLSLNVIDMVNVYEDSMTATAPNSSLQKTFIDQELFLDHETYVADNCYDVIEKILTIYNAVIFQEDAAWQIIRVPETFQALNYRIYNSSLALQSSGSVDNVKTLSANNAAASDFLRFINNDAIISATLPQAKITFDRPLMNQLLLDTGFENSSAISDLYTDTNSIGSYVTENDGNRVLRLEWKDNGYYLEYKTAWHETVSLVGDNSQNFKITGRYKAELPAPGVNPGFIYPPEVVIDNGSNEYMNDDDGSWLIDTGWPYNPTDIRVDDEQWHDFEYETDDIPAGNWDVKIRFLIFQDVDYVRWDNVNIYFQGALVNEAEEITINADNLYGDVDSAVTLYVTDSDVINSQELDKNALSLTAEAVADTWQSLAGSVSKELYLLCQDVYKANYMSPKRIYQGVLKGQFNYYKSLYDSDNRYFPARVRYNVVDSTWDGEWVNINRLWSADIVGTFSNGSPSGSDSYDTFSTSANQVDIIKTQGSAIDRASLTSTSVTAGTRYRLRVTIVDNEVAPGTPSDIPEFDFGGTTKTDLAVGSNEWEVIADTTESDHHGILESAATDLCDLELTVYIDEAIGI